MSSTAAVGDAKVRELPSVEILGVTVHAVSIKSAVYAIEALIEQGGPSMVITADTSGIVLAQHDRQWMDIMNGANLVTPDSIGVVWAARRLGTPIRERVTGVDLMDILCSRAAQKGYRVYLLGAAPGVAAQAARNMQERHPGLIVVGARHGYLTPKEEAEVVREIRSLNVDILFVAMGIPKQEKFIFEHLYEMAAKVSIGVGGSFDVWSGNVRRAPKFVRAMRLEWLWRLLLNPRKWRKALTLPQFLWLILTRARR